MTETNTDKRMVMACLKINYVFIVATILLGIAITCVCGMDGGIRYSVHHNDSRMHDQTHQNQPCGMVHGCWVCVYDLLYWHTGSGICRNKGCHDVVYCHYQCIQCSYLSAACIQT